MEQDKSEKIEQDLRQIADMLLLNGTLTECPGLVNGKMGIAIFFFHYAKHTGIELYEDYAIDLINEMKSQLHNNSPADYKTGLAGIGVGIDYLITNRFLNDDNDIFEDFDERMYRAVIYDPWDDFSLYDGITGYGRYWMRRLRKQMSSMQQARECLLHIAEWITEKITDIPEKEQTDLYCFLQDLLQIRGFEIYHVLLEKCRSWNLSLKNNSQCFNRLGDSAAGNFVRMYQSGYYFNSTQDDEIDNALKQIPDFDMEKSLFETGLFNGYAGEGMLRLTALNQENISWMQLI